MKSLIDAASALADEYRFGLAVVGAAVVKVMLSDNLGWKKGIATVFIAIFGAWLLTEYVANRLGVSEKNYHVVGAAIALTAEQIARAVMSLNVKEIVDRFGKG